MISTEYELMVCKSAAGYYIGTMVEMDGLLMPNSRESVEYWDDYEAAENALKNKTWTQRLNP